MKMKVESLAAAGTANEAEFEAANFVMAAYADQRPQANSFQPIGIAALRVMRLARRNGLTADRATLSHGAARRSNSGLTLARLRHEAMP